MSSHISVFNNSKSREKFLKAYNILLDSWSLPYEDKWVDTSFGKTHVVVTGPVDGKPLVLLPGAQATSGMWGPMLPALTKGRRVFCVDLIDQVGLSQPKKVLTCIQDSNTWLKETLDGLNLTTVDIGGNSLGSFVVSMFAVSYPDRVDKLILTAPAATVTGVRLSYILKVIFASMSSKVSTKARFLKKTAAGFVDEKNRLFQVLLSAMTNSKIISKITPRSLTIDELLNIKSPTLIILGDKDISSSKKADKVVKELSELELGFQLEVLKEAGHLWNDKQLKSAGNMIKDFLDNTL